jgi:proline iminopeptidase
MRAVAVALLLAGSLQACSPDEPPSIEERWLSLPEGDSLHYTISGSGSDTLLVLGGGPGWSSSYLVPPLDDLTPEYGLVFLDLRGRGQSSAVGDSLGVSLETDLRDLTAAQEALGIGRVGLAGHGYGAGLAAMYALRHPERVKQLVLISPMFTSVNLVWQASFQPNDSIATARYLVARKLGRDTLDPRGFCQDFWGFDLSPVEETDPAVVSLLANEICAAAPVNLNEMGLVNHAIRRSLGSWDWSDSLARLALPTLVIQGGGNLFLQRTGQIWAELIPGASLVALSQHPHFPWFDRGDEFTASIRKFLQDTELRTARYPQHTRDKAVTAAQR